MKPRLPMAWLIRLGLALVACALALLVEWQRPEFLVRLDEGLRDSFVRFTVNTEAENRLAIIDINEASLRDVGPWPWSRQQVAELVEILLGTYGARAVGLDIVFAEPGDVNGDERLASLAAHAPLTLAQVFDYTPRSPALLQGVLAGGSSGSVGLSAFPAFGYIANHAGLSGARCIGNIGYLPDPDGVLRHTPVRSRFQAQDFAHFASVLLNCPTVASDRDAPLKLSPQLNLSDERGLWRVPYTRALTAYTVVSAADILNESAPPSLLAGRYVLVGSSSLGLGDRVSTPLTPLSSGVMVHAASLTGLLDLTEMRANAPWSGRGWLVLWCVLSIALAVFFIAKLSAWGGLLLLGFGPVGQALGVRLAALGMNVTVCARRAEQRAVAESFGLRGAALSRLDALAPAFDTVVNTVPARVLTAPVLAALRPGSLIIDLASKPGGTDFDAARRLGHKVIHALSLPAVCAPETAGEAVAHTVLTILREREERA